jgi:hypothetical protein
MNSASLNSSLSGVAFGRVTLMRRFLAFIPRRYRLARWRVLLGAALTLAWWSYVGYHFVYDSIADAAVYLFVASWPLHGLACLLAVRHRDPRDEKINFSRLFRLRQISASYRATPAKRAIRTNARPSAPALAVLRGDMVAGSLTALKTGFWSLCGS